MRPANRRRQHRSRQVGFSRDRRISPPRRGVPRDDPVPAPKRGPPSSRPASPSVWAARPRRSPRCSTASSADGYIQRSGRPSPSPTQGRALADSVIRKHRLAERLLVDVIGLPWHKAHLEAGRWEHVISDEVEQRLVELLGNPTTCPHGNPIPGASGAGGPRRPVSAAWPTSSPASTVRLERITEEVELDMASLEYLDEHGLIPGRSARVQATGARRHPDPRGRRVDGGPGPGDLPADVRRRRLTPPGADLAREG